MCYSTCLLCSYRYQCRKIIYIKHDYNIHKTYQSNFSTSLIPHYKLTTFSKQQVMLMITPILQILAQAPIEIVQAK